MIETESKIIASLETREFHSDSSFLAFASAITAEQPIANTSTDSMRSPPVSLSSPSPLSHSTTNVTCHLGEAARIQKLYETQCKQSLQGSEHYRPLVGGMAAAAYEAMKEEYYGNL